MGAAPTPQPLRPEVRPDDVDVVDLGEEDSLDDAAEVVGSTMQAYLKAVRARLQFELKPNFPSLQRKWLLEEIKERSWWLRAERVAWVKGRLTEEETRAAGLLRVDFEPAYIRDVYIWLPDVRWKTMPCCPGCGQDEHVGNHGFQSRHYARRYAEPPCHSLHPSPLPQALPPPVCT